MGSPLLERGAQTPKDLTQRIAARIERRAMIPDLRDAATTLRRAKFRILGISGFTFNEIDTVEEAIIRAGTGCITASRFTDKLGYSRVLESYAFVRMGEPNPEEVDFVQNAIREMTTLPPDPRFLSFVDVSSESVLILGAVDLKTQEITRYEVALQDASS